MTGDAQDYSEAYLNGWIACAKGHDVELNPYHAELQARSKENWDSGWCARYNALKHDLDHLALDRELGIA